MLEKIDGFIIKTIDYSETHKIVTIFSKKIGKFTAIARGAKKPKSRMAALTQPFIYGQFFVYLQQGLSTIQQGEIIQSYRNIREDIVKTAYASYVSELTDKLLDDRRPDYYLFDQFRLTFDWISDHNEYEIPVLMYELKLFKKGGFAPVVDACVQCGKKNSPYAFSIREGGLLCTQCKAFDPEAVMLSDVLVRLLYIFSTVGLERVNSISLKAENRTMLRRLLDAYYDEYGGYKLKSKKFLQQIHHLE